VTIVECHGGYFSAWGKDRVMKRQSRKALIDQPLELLLERPGRDGTGLRPVVADGVVAENYDFARCRHAEIRILAGDDSGVNGHWRAMVPRRFLSRPRICV
jgi:hypothetical protein